MNEFFFFVKKVIEKVFLDSRESTRCSSAVLFKVPLAVLTIMANLYCILALLTQKKARKLDFVLIAVQSFTDLVVSGLYALLFHLGSLVETRLEYCKLHAYLIDKALNCWKRCSTGILRNEIICAVWKNDFSMSVLSINNKKYLLSQALWLSIYDHTIWLYFQFSSFSFLPVLVLRTF